MPYDKNGKKRKVRRLVDVDVSHVSLVDRPANRTPFKAIKRDGTNGTTEGKKPMNVTLKNLFHSRAPAVTSVIADTQEKAAALAKMLLDADEATITETDGVYVARPAGEEAQEGEQLVHLGKSAGCAYTVNHLRKELALFDMEGEAFGDALQAEGFVPGLYIGMDALQSTIRNIAMAEDTDSPEAFAGKVRNAIEDFASYVDSMITALPEKAFKFEKALTAVTPTGQIRFTPEGFNSEVYDAVFGDKQYETEQTMGDADGDGGAPAEAAEADAKPEAEAAPAAEADAEAEGDKVEAAADEAPANFEPLPEGTPAPPAVDMEKAVQEALATVLSDVSKSVGDQITEAVKPLADKAAKQDAAIDKLTKAVGGSVAATPDEDTTVVELRKGDEPGGERHIPLMDTAYNVSKG